MDCEEKKISSELLYSGRILELYKDKVQLPNGETSDREYVHHNGGASVLAKDEDNNIYLVEQYRYPYHTMTLEIPAGKLNKGEDAKECAVRELKEEVGLTALEMEDWGIIYPTPAYTDEPLHIFYTDQFECGDSQLDDNEFLNVRKVSIDRAVEMVEVGIIRDSKTVVAILRLALRIEENR
mgnify:CR=1 FL=1